MGSNQVFFNPVARKIIISFTIGYVYGLGRSLGDKTGTIMTNFKPEDKSTPKPPFPSPNSSPS